MHFAARPAAHRRAADVGSRPRGRIPGLARGDQRYKDRIGDLLTRWVAGGFEKRELAHCGGTIYAALRGAGLGGGGGSQETIATMLSRSRARMWFPVSGDEWGFARYVRHGLQHRGPCRQDSLRRNVAWRRAPFAGYQGSLPKEVWCL